MVTDLKPCPFCAAPPSRLFNLTLALRFWAIGWHIDCLSCGMNGPAKVSRQRAVDAWNYRPLEILAEARRHTQTASD